MIKLKQLLGVLFMVVLLVACGGADSADTHEHSEDDEHANETDAAHSDTDEPHADEDDDEHDDEHDKDHDDEHDDEHDEDHDDEHDDDHDDEHDDHDDDASREQGAHEHGAAELNIAWSGNALAIDLMSPSYNVLGFEYTPATDDEKQAAADSVAVLEQGEFLQFTAAAECAIVSADIHTGFEESGDDEESTHSDIDAEYSVECAHPEDLTSLDLSGLFSQFGNFEDLRVQWISDESASAETITPDSPIISFE